MGVSYRGESSPPALVAVVGPTGVGKTAVGMELAARLGGEIVSADAVAVYRGLDIGAAKPTARERTRVPFHVIDVAEPDEDFTVADFARLAEEAMAAIRGRGRIPLLVGGTGLYVRSLTATLSLPPVPPQPELRAALAEEAERRGIMALHRRLAETDPASAKRILPGDLKRIIRALEVCLTTGRTLSSFHTPEGVRGIPRPNTYIFGLTRARPLLYERIEARVDAMLAAGLTDEVRGLLAAGHGPQRKSMQSLGYRHLMEHLTEGKELDTAVLEMKRDTRRYAKRQLSWFHAGSNVQWIDAEGYTGAEVSRLIAARLRGEYG